MYLIFVVCQSTAKTAKIGSLENFRLYGRSGQSHHVAQQEILELAKTLQFELEVSSLVGFHFKTYYSIFVVVPLLHCELVIPTI